MTIAAEQSPADTLATTTAPRAAFNDGAIEAAKWIGLLLMTADHANKYLFDYAFATLFDLGRIALPLFCFALGYNLARPGAMARGVHVRVMKRLAIYGLVATVPYMLLGKLGWGWWPLNILFTLLAATTVIYLLEKGGALYGLAAIGLLIASGPLVEYWWWGILACVTAWGYAKSGHWATLLLWVLCLASLAFINGSYWALVAIPIIFGLDRIAPPMPRSGHAFYIFYPAHLALILVAAQIIG